jgi:antitoxin (DNA-binding transcriptional repressor) of toxin-antitoxin stability system
MAMVSVQMGLDQPFSNVQDVQMESTRSSPPAPDQVPVTVFRARVAYYLNLVCYRGVSIFLMRKGKAVARLEPLTEEATDKILAKNTDKSARKL